MKRIITISKKEFIHIFRDPRTIGVVVFIPIFLLTLFGYALTLDVKNISTALVDLNHTKISRDFVANFSNSGYFKINYQSNNINDIKELIDMDKINFAIVIPADFSQKLSSGKDVKIQTIFNGVNANTAIIAKSYVERIIANYWKQHLKAGIEKKGLSSFVELDVLKFDPRFWYNPTLKSMNFLVPGLICIILMMLSALLTSMTIVSERERGTIELLIVSPIKKSELLIGKLIPYIVIAFLDILLVIAIGTLWFGVPIEGNLFLLMFLSSIFLFSALGIGLLISTIAKSGKEAYLMAIMVSVLPSIMLSGFQFPISSMPWVLQGISFLIPARYFLIIIRGIFLKGIGISYLWPNALALVFFGVFMVTVSILRFKEKLD